MNELININEQRAQFYWWMASVFAKELTTEDLTHYNSLEVTQYINALGETPELEVSAKAFLAVLHAQQVREDGQLELAADFCGLFLTTAEVGALPYASSYLEKSGLLNGKPAEEMAKWMQRFKMGQKQEINEPFDHLALILDFLGNLIINTNQFEDESAQEAMLLEQHEFMQSMLFPWIEAFQRKVKAHDAFGFYAALTNLLVEFILLDMVFLAGEE